MLKKIRVVLAWVVFVAALALVVVRCEGLSGWLGWIAKLQVVPAILAGSFIAILVVVLLTVLFGRVYCSVLCPTGIMQDGISWVSSRRKGCKSRFRYTRSKNWWRGLFLGAFVVATVLGTMSVVSLLDPWAIFGRTAGIAFTTSVWVLCVAVVTFVIITVMAWRGGRTWCGTVCPVGTILGLVGCKPVFAPRFVADKCTRCGLCEKKCKGGCVDVEAQKIDYSRCVMCFDCVEACKFGAMKYTTARGGCGTSTCEASRDSAPRGGGAESGSSRRNFLSLLALLAVGTVKAQQPLVNVDGGLAEIEDKKRPVRKNRVVPPGAKGEKNVAKHCTACQLCVTSCPGRILVPSAKLETFMQPEMTFEKGYCRPECVECGEVCPTGAIRRVTKDEKAAISVGNANWIADNCVVNRDSLPCTACERHCPTKAITLVPLNAEEAAKEAAPPPRWGRKPPVLKVPVVDNTKCIGCGACEFHCPARPFAAIFVEGNSVHHDL